ncbi:peptide ABC transporter ATP-binding protein [Staphylococcus microti]|uniref:Oligopeptide transport ATP-binding protein n=1 Tax=Staphylococcus microti TaxID=569857 RepID=A0A0D6XSH2_9STAP|nr:ABC transporter ATP-binding protein [Staphylococcus microti]KIX90788.1 peptide ABC transporter ATP-binding protein [Staphylococcus microti]PNZ82180.1 ABC transporter ATP-binding protein [Staphylococcus microti]SUM57448.1 oligopeptide transport ATP-binding protein [Staphylococcus microti]
MEERELLKVKDLCAGFEINGQRYNAISNINLTVNKGEVMGIVGESGSGKSVLSMSILQLLPDKIGEIHSGEVYFKQQRIDTMDMAQFNQIRGNALAMIFQEPMTSLNPVFTIGNQLIEMMVNHLNINKSEAKSRAISLLKQVGIPRAEQVVDSYPHQLSGGMRQRVMIAMAISCSPELLIADEPTTALDVTVQAQILELLKSIQQETDMGIIFISHDLGVISEVCDNVAVMYAGEIVERASVKDIFSDPKHPYTKLLIKAIPRLDIQQDRLETIEGTVPGLNELPEVGCKFANRCPNAMPVCTQKNLNTIHVSDTHRVACHLFDESVMNDGVMNEGGVQHVE